MAISAWLPVQELTPVVHRLGPCQQRKELTGIENALDEGIICCTSLRYQRFQLPSNL